jgi:hypothetical protein
MILVHNTRKVGDHLKEYKDEPFVTVAEDWDIWLKNSLVEDLVVFTIELWTMKYCIDLE